MKNLSEPCGYARSRVTIYLTATIVARGPWNRGCIIRMEAEAGIGGQGGQQVQ
jgi:hypothetical protein